MQGLEMVSQNILHAHSQALGQFGECFDLSVSGIHWRLPVTSAMPLPCRWNFT